MSERLFVGLDVGTSGSRAVLYDTSGRQVATTHHGYPLETPHPGWAEQDPDLIWQRIVETLADLSKLVPAGATIEALGISSICHSLVGVDRASRPVTPSIIWADLRSHHQVEQLRGRVDARALYESTGCPLHPMYLPGKILWLKEEQPETYAKIAVFGSIKDEVIYRLTGVRVVDKGIATASGLFDLVRVAWSETWLETLGISLDQLPPVIESTASAGGLLGEVARATGLPAGLPIIAGSGDGPLSSFGSGAVAPGQMAVMIGTSGAARLAADRPIFDKEGRTWCYYLADGRWIAGAAINNGGLALQWVRENLLPGPEADGEEFDFVTLAEEAEESGPGSGGLLFLPFLAGERSPYWNANARGVIFGLAQHMGPPQVARSVFEGVCYRMRSIVDALDEAAGPTTEVRATGGFVRSEFWRQMLSDTLGRPMSIPNAPQASAFGAAGLAMIGTGAMSSLEAVARLVEVEPGPQPKAERHQLYDRLYRLYMEIYWGSQHAFQEIAAIQEELGKSTDG